MARFSLGAGSRIPAGSTLKATPGEEHKEIPISSYSDTVQFNMLKRW
jgi:hypothetical protein